LRGSAGVVVRADLETSRHAESARAGVVLRALVAIIAGLIREFVGTPLVIHGLAGINRAGVPIIASGLRTRYTGAFPAEVRIRTDVPIIAHGARGQRSEVAPRSSEAEIFRAVIVIRALQRGAGDAGTCDVTEVPRGADIAILAGSPPNHSEDTPLRSIAAVRSAGIPIITGEPIQSRIAESATAIIPQGAGASVIAVVLVVHMIASVDGIAGIIRTGVAILTIIQRARSAGPVQTDIALRTGVPVITNQFILQMLTPLYRVTIIIGTGIVVVAVLERNGRTLPGRAFRLRRTDVAVLTDIARVTGLNRTRLTHLVAGIHRARVPIIALTRWNRIDIDDAERIDASHDSIAKEFIIQIRAIRVACTSASFDEIPRAGAIHAEIIHRAGVEIIAFEPLFEVRDQALPRTRITHCIGACASAGTAIDLGRDIDHTIEFFRADQRPIAEIPVLMLRAVGIRLARAFSAWTPETFPAITGVIGCADVPVITRVLVIHMLAARERVALVVCTGIPVVTFH
jgi:hypothetical protein